MQETVKIFLYRDQWKNPHSGIIRRTKSHENPLALVPFYWYIVLIRERHNMKEMQLWIAARDGLLSCTVSMQLSSMQCDVEHPFQKKDTAGTD